MSDTTASPKATRLATPTWLDTRLVLGVLLVLVSVVVGARVLSSADESQRVWVVTRDLAAGTTLAEGDLRAGKAQLFDSGDRYLLAGGVKPVGYVLQRGVGVDELLPRDSLVRPDQPGRALRDVAVPVAAGHLPDDLRAGQQVDVYVTSAAAGAPAPGGTQPGTPASPAPSAGETGTRRVLSAATVALRRTSSGLGSTAATGVVLSVPDADAALLVAAVQEGTVDLVRVPGGSELPALPAATPAVATGSGG